MNILFSTGVFLTILNVEAKIAPAHRKDSKLDFPNCRPTSLLSNIEKIKKLMYNRVQSNKFLVLENNFNFHLLISLTEDIRKNFDTENIDCGILADFDTLLILPNMISC